MKLQPPTLHLLDANVLIDAHNKYYPVDMVPEFWDWLLHSAAAGLVAMPLEIFEEVRPPEAKKDHLNHWLCQSVVEETLVLREEVDSELLTTTVLPAYATDLDDNEVELLGRDPFLITYGLVGFQGRCVVSNEVSKPSRLRANRKVPDVCRSLGVQCCDTFAMLRQLGFSTSWAVR